MTTAVERPVYATKCDNSPGLAYYNFDKILSFNGIYNFLIGARGLGKTYGAKLKVIRWAIKDGQQFIYLRRFKEEMKASRPTFFADIAHEFPDYDFRVNGDTAEMAPASTRDDKKRAWQIIGYFAVLSQGQTKKGVSYPLVRTIIFDEFIIEKGLTHYLPNEAIVMQNFYSTVDRWKDKTRVLFLANSVSISNPYFLQYNIRPDETTEFHQSHKLTDGRHFVVAHFADSKEFSSGVFATAFGQFIKDTEYADYAVSSEFADNHKNLLACKPSEALYWFTLETGHGTFSIWRETDTGSYFMQEKRPKREKMLTLLPEKMSETKQLIPNNDRILGYLRAAFGQGRAYFDTQKTRNAFIEIYQR